MKHRLNLQLFWNEFCHAFVKAVYSQISEGDLHKKNQEIVELSRQNREKDNKIIELQTAFAKEQQKKSVKNVLADDKKDKADKPKTTRKRITKSVKTDESKE